VEESDFNQKVDDILAIIEDALDNCDADLDWDRAGGILTIECVNGSQVIVNRQGPTQQIWVASRSGGFHFDFYKGKGKGEGEGKETDCWLQGDLELFTHLNQALSEQSGESVKLN
jgi:CyaY protein